MNISFGLKRAFDVIAAGMGLIVLAPVMAVIGIAVRLDSRGPALFRQERIGRGGVPFQIHKFRSMHVNNGVDALLTTANDGRITRVGRFIRRLKLDELPQLFDVLIGKMSLVGPRPEVARYVAYYPAEARAIILSLRPGITDLASIMFRSESDLLRESDDPEQTYLTAILPLKVRLYLEYAENRTFVGDIRIILATLGIGRRLTNLNQSRSG